MPWAPARMAASSIRPISASSRSEAARSANPMAARRRAPWPTSGAMLIAPPDRPSAARYCRKLRQSQATSEVSQ